MRIEPLSKRTLDEAKNLVNHIFPLQDEWERSDFWLEASLNFGRLKIRLPVKDVRGFGYWVAIEGGNIVGIIGLYGQEDDIKEAFWVGWFCVDPAFRGRGIGRELLEFAIQRSRAEGKKYLRLYTSDDPNEAVAQTLYEKLGFKVTKKNVRQRGGKWNVFYRELKL